MSTPRLLPLLAALALAGCARTPPPAGPGADGTAKQVRIVATNDFHGRLLPQTPSWANGRVVGGSAVLAAHFDSAAARFDGPTFILSGGDDMQGTAISNLTWGRSTIDAMNAEGYDAAAFGNHEFDWGLDTLRTRVGESRFPWLAANLYTAGTATQPRWVKPWTMLQKQGVRVAVIGAALPSTPEIVMAGRVRGLHFGPAVPAIDRAARQARAAGADFVVVTMHVGARCETPGREAAEVSQGCAGEVLDIARRLREPVDLILGGHTHQRVLTSVRGIPVSEAASYSTAYSVTDLARAGRSARVLRQEVRTPWADEVDPDTALARVVAGWETRVRPLSVRVVAESAIRMVDGEGEYPLGNLLADAQRASADAQVGLVNNGSIRRDLPAGPLTYGTLYELQPFQNELVRVTLTGAQLRQALEEAALTPAGQPEAHVSGMTVSYDPAAPRGRRIREIRLEDGRVLGEGDTVTLGTSEFVATGGDGFAALEAGRLERTGVVDLDGLVEYLQRQPQPLQPPATGRWIAVR